LKKKFYVLATQGTKNTPLWISQVILNELNEQHEVFIVEMWAYEKGNIAELCGITKPNVSVITGITLQHLERFGSLDEIIDTKFEIFEALEKDDFAVIDISTLGAQRWLSEKKFQVENIIPVSRGTPYIYREKLWGIEFELEGEKIETKILSNYIVETIQICHHVAKHLGMDMASFKSWVAEIDFVEHRMQLIYNQHSRVSVIDDSFNGNIEGVKSILHLMEHTPFTWRKILIAGWVVELWKQSVEVNSQLWREMSIASDMVLLVEWPIGNAIADGLMDAGFHQHSIKMYPSPLSLHDDLKNITKSGDMIVFQNDLPDTYL
jgi:UDP-N-acetylmuramoyl-tripeptide--D-alanyl-D-alanine ligase